jgi:hypothetical protein
LVLHPLQIVALVVVSAFNVTGLSLCPVFAFIRVVPRLLVVGRLCGAPHTEELLFQR